MLLKGASILVECLKEQKVDTVFGYPGGAVLEIYDELYKHQSEIRHILTCHEQGAAHAADGYGSTVQISDVLQMAQRIRSVRKRRSRNNFLIWSEKKWQMLRS